MPLVRSDHVQNRHSRQGTGGVLAAAKQQDPVRQPVYMNSTGAASAQLVRNSQRPPPLPARYPHASATSLIQFAPQVSPDPYPPPVSGHLAWGGAPAQQSNSLGLSKWTSYSHISQSVTDIVSQTTGKANATILELEDLVLQSMNGGKNVRESTTRLLDQVITSIDIGSFCGKEKELRQSLFSTVLFATELTFFCT